jgi:hypothetical protein
MTSPEIRPRADTVNPLAAAHSRIGPASSRGAVEPVLMRCGRRARCPPSRRAAAIYGAKMSRSFAALSLLRSISRAKPSSANEIDSSASEPTVSSTSRTVVTCAMFHFSLILRGCTRFSLVNKKEALRVRPSEPHTVPLRTGRAP